MQTLKDNYFVIIIFIIYHDKILKSDSLQSDPIIHDIRRVLLDSAAHQ